MKRLAFITECLDGMLDEGSINTAAHLIRSLSDKVAAFQIYTRGVNNPSGNLYHSLPGNKALLGFDFYQQLSSFKPEYVLYLPASSGTLGGFLRGYVLKLISGATKTALIYLQPRSITPILRMLARIGVVDVVFVQSEQTLRTLKNAGFNVCRIPVGVDTSIFTPVDPKSKSALRKKFELPEHAKIVLHVGHLNGGRNIQDALQLQSNGYLVLLVISDRFEQDTCLKEILLQSGVRIISRYLENIEEIYQLSDVYLFPTVQTSNAIEAPLSVLEAMACNLPVVTTRFGALPDIFQPGDGLFYCDRSEDLLGLIELAYQHPACKTRNKVLSFSWEHVAGQILENL